jgi:hypothetical protein
MAGGAVRFVLLVGRAVRLVLLAGEAIMMFYFKSSIVGLSDEAVCLVLLVRLRLMVGLSDWYC